MAIDVRSMILVVDDEEALASVIAGVLEDEGHTVQVVHDGASALTRMREDPRPCLAFLDLMMPGITGWDVRRAMLADPTLSAIPVAIVSAFVVGEVAELQPAAVVQKPFSLDRIVEIAESHCGPPPL
jgi:two-component system, chemotaxis family, chemotaxis protein CheY